MRIVEEIDGIKAEFELLSGAGEHPKAWGSLDDEALATAMDKVIEREIQSQEELMALAKRRVGKGAVIYIGYDCEWEEINGKLVAQSYQFYVIGPGGEFWAVFLPTSDKLEGRLAFKELLAILIERGKRFGVIVEPPKRVLVAGYFLRADLAMLGDLVEFKQELDNVGGSIATTGKPLDFEILYKRWDLEERLNGTSLDVIDGEDRFGLPVSFIDMKKHDPEDKGLFALGNLVGIPKVELPVGYTIDKISRLKRDNWEKFVEYGVTDAKIAVRYYLDVLKFAKTLLAVDGDYDLMPATAGSLAVQYCRKTFEGDDLDFEELFGVQEDEELEWSGHRTYPKRQTKMVLDGHREFFENFAVKCFLGGRNETFYVGPAAHGLWHDYDLIGAYTTALAVVREIDYENAHTVTSENELVGDKMGFAWVDFAFPEGTRFPCLPVRTKERGLIFPMRGRSYCTSPEIELAVSMKAKIALRRGVVYPWRGDNPKRFFVPFVQTVRELRAQYKKSGETLREKYAKLIGNSLYGKTGQGLKEKTVFNTRDMDSQRVPPSMLTNAPVAALVTGMVRATVGEILYLLPRERTVISVTTDGILTDASLSELNLSGPICQRYQELVSIITNGSSTKMVEEKHRLRQALSIRTRGLATLQPGEEDSGIPTIFLAKSSISPPPNCSDANAYVLDLYFNRQPGQKTMTRPFVSPRDQWIKEMDVFRLERLQTLNMEYDMKRRPMNPRTVDTLCGAHVAFDTIPWDTAKQAVKVRGYLDEWRKTRCLKTVEQYKNWEDYYLTHWQLERVRKQFNGARLPFQVTEEGSLGILKRMFLRAYVQGGWGLQRKDKTENGEKFNYRLLLQELEYAGLPVSEHDAKNGNKGKVIDNIVPRTPLSEEAIGRLMLVFDGIDMSKVFIPDPDPEEDAMEIDPI